MKEESVAINARQSFSSESKHALIVRFHDRVTI